MAVHAFLRIVDIRLYQIRGEDIPICCSAFSLLGLVLESHIRPTLALEIHQTLHGGIDIENLLQDIWHQMLTAESAHNTCKKRRTHPHPPSSPTEKQAAMHMFFFDRKI
jgi:hypothetical protein